MTILYKPVLIESAEQAETLPEGTFVPRLNGRLPKKRKNGTWGDSWGDCCLFDILDWTAFVPIEAEEVPVIASGGLERDYHGATVFNHTPDGPRRDYRRTEFHTPWEEA